MNSYTISEEGEKLIKSFEGCRLKAYRCPAGKLTIGYGHTNNVYADDVITQDEADKLFKQDVIIHENNVNKLVKVPLTQNQFNALVSLEYNIGYGNFASSTILKLLNAGNYEAAGKRFLVENPCAKTKEDKYYGSFVFDGNKKVLDGLVKRRKCERELFFK